MAPQRVRRVVLPQPLRPRRAVTRPAAHSRETPRRASTPPWYTLVTSRMEMADKGYAPGFLQNEANPVLGALYVCRIVSCRPVESHNYHEQPLGLCTARGKRF